MVPELNYGASGVFDGNHDSELRLRRAIFNDKMTFREVYRLPGAVK